MERAMAMYTFLMTFALILTGLVLSTPAFSRQLSESDRAPLFVLKDTKGNPFSLKGALKSYRYVVIVFYPKDNSSVCTKQACRIRDIYSRVPKDVIIVGISHGTVQSHQHFIAQNQIPYRLLIDEHNAVRTAYGAYRGWVIPDRVTFVIDQSGCVVKKYAGMFSLDEHMALIEDILKDVL
jgi:peroxiredoxin Q/BCP